jgi:hypothetical protein
MRPSPKQRLSRGDHYCHGGVRLLLDAQVFWAPIEAKRLSVGIRTLWENRDNEVAFSAATLGRCRLGLCWGCADFQLALARDEAAQATGFVGLP